MRSADRGLVVRLGLAVVAACAAAVPVALLAILVEHPLGPVVRQDHWVARGLHGFAADHRWFVHLLDVVSTVGDPTTFRLGATIAALWLLAGDRPRLALWTLVTTWGGALLGVVLKLVVARARPVLPDPVASAPGYSFPSGHALGAFVGCAVLLLLWLAMAGPRRRWIGWVGAGAVTALVGFARIGLGVHYLSDVLGGYLVGLGWVAATTIVFEIWRVEAGLPPAHVVAEGLEPERVEPHRHAGKLPPLWVSAVEIWRHLRLRLALCWVALVGAMIGVGWAVTRWVGEGPPDGPVSRWFTDQRTPALNGVSRVGSLLGETSTVVVVTAVGYLVARLVFRRWHESTALLFATVGQALGFLVITIAVDRQRPLVPHLDASPPTNAFPSGHTAAALCCYGALALVIGRAARRWLQVVLAAGAAALVIAVATARLYRGMHHLTDVCGSLVYGGIWLAVVAVLVLRAPCPPEPTTLPSRLRSRTPRLRSPRPDPAPPRPAPAGARSSGGPEA